MAAPPPVPIVRKLGPFVSGILEAHDVLVLTASTSLHPEHPEPEERRLARAALLPMVVQEVRVRDAGPMLQLLGVRFAPPPVAGNRVLPNGYSLEQVAGAADLVRLLVDPVLPSLRLRPTDATRLRLVALSARKIQDYARAVGGSFRKVALDFALKLSEYVDDAALLHHGVYAPLQARVDGLLDDAREFLDSLVTLKLPNAEESAAAWMEAAAAGAAAEAALGGGNDPLDA